MISHCRVSDVSGWLPSVRSHMPCEQVDPLHFATPSTAVSEAALC